MCMWSRVPLCVTFATFESKVEHNISLNGVFQQFLTFLTFSSLQTSVSFNRLKVRFISNVILILDPKIVIFYELKLCDIEDQNVWLEDANWAQSPNSKPRSESKPTHCYRWASASLISDLTSNNSFSHFILRLWVHFFVLSLRNTFVVYICDLLIDWFNFEDRIRESIWLKTAAEVVTDGHKRLKPVFTDNSDKFYGIQSIIDSKETLIRF